MAGMSDDEQTETIRDAYDDWEQTEHQLCTWPAFRAGYAEGLAARAPGPATGTYQEIDSFGRDNLISELEAARAPGPAMANLIAAARFFHAIALQYGHGPQRLDSEFARIWESHFDVISDAVNGHMGDDDSPEYCPIRAEDAR
jgi:hypothetical protein